MSNPTSKLEEKIEALVNDPEVFVHYKSTGKNGSLENPVLTRKLAELLSLAKSQGREEGIKETCDLVNAIVVDPDKPVQEQIKEFKTFLSTLRSKG